VAYQVSGSILGKSRIIHLADYGGLTAEGLKNFEIWRLLSSQLIHVHQYHMIYNVLSILLLGLILERKIGFRYTFAIWLLAGALGTLFSIQFSSPPWNTGTGASQAAFGLAGFALLLVIKRVEQGYLIIGVLAFALFPALYLDFKSAGYAKPAHVLSFVIGCTIASYYLFRTKRQRPYFYHQGK
jgi:membrane associated rhomboid family serine protease